MSDKTCWHCNGSGQEEDHSRPIPYKHAPIPKKICSICAGTGRVPDHSTTQAATGGCALLITTAGIVIAATAIGLVKVLT